VRPSHRREMARQEVTERAVPITLACEAFRISETCYRYQPKKEAEDALIERWLILLTDQHNNWSAGLGTIK
jgi:putative transposase